jgi:hypothetical protein
MQQTQRMAEVARVWHRPFTCWRFRPWTGGKKNATKNQAQKNVPNSKKLPKMC